MKKLFSSYLLLSLLGFCVSCSRYESPMDDPEEPVRYVTLSMKVDIDTTNNVSTKTSMVDSTGVVKWSNEDKVTIYFQDMNVSSLQVLGSVSNISSDGKSATFSYSVPAGDSSYAAKSAKYVCYGNQNITVDQRNKPSSISLPSVQQYAGDKCFEEGENVSIGYLGGGYYDEQKGVYVKPDTVCVMKNVFGILKVNVKLDDSSKKIDYIQLTDNKSGNYLAGEFEFSQLPSSNTSDVPRIQHKSGTGGESLSIIKKVNGTVNGGDFYFLVPPGTLFSEKGFNLYIYTKDGFYAGKKVKPKGTGGSIDRSMITNVTLGTFTNREIPVTSNPNTANSYIVPAVAGPYSIPAQYMGNGYQGNGGSSVPQKSNEISGGVSAEIMWQGRLNGDSLIDGELISDPIYFTKTVNGNSYGYIGFHRSGVPGNALIALKNSSGTILWSWHVWITSESSATEAGVMLKSQNDGSDVIKIMDRNLGALYADPTKTATETQTHGLAYQFGRKDPYMGSRYTKTDQSTATEYKSFASIYPGTAIYCIENEKALNFDINASIESPFIRSLRSNGAWCMNLVSWGDLSSGDMGATTYKSLYDPCPVGWRTFEEKYIVSALGKDENKKINRPDGTVVTSGQGYAFKLNNKNNPIFFPASGYSTTTYAVTYVGTVVALWGSNYSEVIEGQDTRTEAKYLRITLNGTGAQYESQVGAMGMSATMPVRCQKWTEPNVSNGTSTPAPSLVRSAECQEEELEVVYID